MKSSISRRAKVCYCIACLIVISAGVVVALYFTNVISFGSLSGKLTNSALKTKVVQLSAVPKTTIVLKKRAAPPVPKLYFELSQAPQGTNGQSWTMIDGLNLNLYQIRLSSDKGQRRDVINDWSASPKKLSIGGEVSATAVVDTADISTVRNPFTSEYLGVDVITEAPFTLKGFCKTLNYIVYTTASGTKKISINSTNLPDDYDYQSFPKPWSVGTGGRVYYNNFYPFTLKTNTTSISSLFDNSYSVECFDGSDFTADGKGMYMQLKNLNVFINVGSNETLIGETHFVSTDLNALTAGPNQFNFNQGQIVAFAYTDKGAVFGAQASYTTMDSLYRLNGPANFVEQLQDGTVTMTDGSQYGPEFRYVQDRIITGFKRPSGSNVVTTVMKDGPDCGKTLNDYNSQNAARACLGAGVTKNLYWIKLLRG